MGMIYFSIISKSKHLILRIKIGILEIWSNYWRSKEGPGGSEIQN
jgi:hypothetical protein